MKAEQGQRLTSEPTGSERGRSGQGVGRRGNPLRVDARRGPSRGRILARRRIRGGRRGRRVSLGRGSRHAARPPRLHGHRQHPPAHPLVVRASGNHRVAGAVPTAGCQLSCVCRGVRGGPSSERTGKGGGGSGRRVPRSGRGSHRIRGADLALVPDGHARAGAMEAVLDADLFGCSRSGPRHVSPHRAGDRHVPRARSDGRVPLRWGSPGNPKPWRVCGLCVRLRAGSMAPVRPASCPAPRRRGAWRGGDRLVTGCGARAVARRGTGPRGGRRRRRS